MKLLFDVTRLLSRAHFPTPTGIDRVDLTYAQALRATPEFDTDLIAFDAVGPYRLKPASADRLIAETAGRWQASSSQRSATFDVIAAWLNAPAGTAAAVADGRTNSKRLNLDAIRRLRHRAGSLQRVRGSEGIYVNTSHGRLFRSTVARWLASRTAGGVFFVHDLIPIEHPEFNRPGEAERHRRRLRLIATHARLVIVNSQATCESLLRWLHEQRLPQPPITVIPLGVADAFARHQRTTILTPTLPYFVVVGTIEPRKNHALLLHLWRRLVQSGSGDVPRLLVIGRRGWENETVFNLLDRTPALQPWVMEASGLNDEEIGQLIRGARALLAPSFAEGYGLPVTEAIASGTPVIASDLPAHREIGSPWIEILDPLDGAAWIDAIRNYARPQSPRYTEARARLAGYSAVSWQGHAAAAIEALKAI
jgi:glycosyltransferase involved in cell wall biosynthesis